MNMSWLFKIYNTKDGDMVPLKTTLIQLCSNRSLVSITCSLESSVTKAAEVEEELGRDDEMVTEDHCLRICNDIGAQWKPVLRHLSLKEKALENLDEDYKNCKVSEKCYQGLLEWVRNGSQKPTTRTLCKALRLAGCSEALETLSKEGMSNQCNSEYSMTHSDTDLVFSIYRFCEVRIGETLVEYFLGHFAKRLTKIVHQT